MAEVSGSIAFIQLLGAVALLLWSLRTIRNGATRAFGARVRQMLGWATRRRVAAAWTGAALAGMLQSSTAVVLLVASFAAQHHIAVPAALAVALGADFGSTLAILVLSLDLSLLAPLAAIFGYILFAAASSKTWRNVGRLLVGLALILVSLKLLVAASAPMRESPTMSLLFDALSGEPLLAIICAALLTWISHSSIAMVLLLVSLCAGGHVTLDLGLYLVLGVNLGAGLPALIATWSDTVIARHVALGNLLFRVAGVALAWPLVRPLIQWLDQFALPDPYAIAIGHVAFNAAVMVIGLPFVGRMARLAGRFLPDEADSSRKAAGEPRYLDRGALSSPAIALANAQREALRMGDIVHTMLSESRVAFTGAEASEKISEIRALDDAVDALNEAIKFYLTDLGRRPLSESDSIRCMTILNFITNLEHLGDIVDRNLMKLAARKANRGLEFSGDGLDEILALHRKLVDNLRLALNIFVSDDDELAEQLVAEKRSFVASEREAMRRHLSRLREGNTRSIETSAIHVDLLRDFKRINSHIAAVAYAVLNSESAKDAMVAVRVAEER